LSKFSGGETLGLLLKRSVGRRGRKGEKSGEVASWLSGDGRPCQVQVRYTVTDLVQMSEWTDLGRGQGPGAQAS